MSRYMSAMRFMGVRSDWYRIGVRVFSSVVLL